MCVAIAILAWRPSSSLVDLVRTLSGKGAPAVLVVDDGSGPEFGAVFEGAAAVPGVHVLRHAVKRGSGAALQTAINHALCTLPDLAGVVATSTEVHPDDILRVAEALRADPESPVLDSRTGLRGIPARLLPGFLQSETPGSFEVGRTPWSAPLAIPALFALAFAVLLGVEIHGLRATHLFAQDIWSPIGLKRFIRYLAEYLAMAVPLLAMVPWTFPGVMSALLLVLTAISVGPQPLFAVGFFLVSACALGSILLGQTKSDSVTIHLCASLLGCGVYVFLMTFMARVPVNYPPVWAILLAIPVAADFRGVWRRLVDWPSRIASVELRSPWERISFALLVFLLGVQWFSAMMPETSADGLAMHLAIPMNIAANHRMTFEPSRYLWSVMPMGADWLYSIVFLLGGEYAARILNFAMLLAMVALLYRATRRWVTPAAGCLLAASLAATPVVQFVTGSLFVENFLVALVLGLMTAIWHFGETGDRRFLYLAMALGGAAMSTKYGALVFLVLALPFAAVEIARHWKKLGPRPAVVCALAVLLLVVTALPTYAIAYEKTGNPIFPFLNPKIHSPLLNPSVLILDARFHVPVDWNALYTLTFHTTKAYEGQDGSFGFQYLVVVPLALFGLVVAKRSPAQAAAVLALGGGVLIMQSTPNVRYLYTAMPLLLIASAAVLGWMSSHHRWMYRVLIVYLFACTALDTYFIPSSSYYHKDFCLRAPFSRTERDRYRDEAAPIRSVVAHYNQNHPNSAVLLTSSTSIAGLTGDVYENNWHQFPIVEQLRAAHTPADMFRLLQRWKVKYFIVEQLAPGDQTVPPPLQALLSACTTKEYAAAWFTLARLEPDCGLAAEDPGTRNPANLGPVPSGVYDDFSPSVTFAGEWTHDKSFDGPYQHTISFSDTPGSEVSIEFQGTSLTYVFTKAPNRGIANVTIDGRAPRTVDLYSADPQWQARQTFCCFSAGKHRAAIQVSGQANRKSTGRFVDIDSFVVQ